MKRGIIILLALLMVLSFSACGSSTKNSQKAETNESAKTASVDAEVPEGWINAYDGKTGLEPAPTKKDKIVLAHTPSAMNTHHQIVIYGLKDQIKKLGLEDKIELIVQAPTGQSAVAEQVAIVEAWIEQGVDAISCGPCAGSDEALMPAYKKAAEAGIPVFEFNTPALGSVSPHLVSNVGYEQPGASGMIAQWIADKANGKELNVAVVQGMPGIHQSERMKGFMGVLDKYDNLKLVADETADDWSVDNAMAVAENMLTANSDVDVIWAQYDELALGVYTVVKSLGLQDKVMVLGYENIPDANESIRLGEMWATVDNGPKQMGRNVITCVNDYVLNGKMVPKIFNLESKVYDRDNIAEFDLSEYTE